MIVFIEPDNKEELCECNHASKHHSMYEGQCYKCIRKNKVKGRYKEVFHCVCDKFEPIKKKS